MRTLTCLLLLSAIAPAAEPRWPIELPLRIEKNLPVAPIQVNGGHTLYFILDTAAADCVIDRDRAAAIGLGSAGSAISSGSGGDQQVGLFEGVRLDLGGVEIRPARCLAFDMKALKFQGRVDGILGMPLFRRYVVEIDYPGARARIFSPKAFRPPANAEMMPIHLTTGPVVVGSIRLRGRAPIPADIQLDTGSAHVITMCSAFVDRENLLANADGLAPGSTLGFGGAARDMVGRIEEVRIGRFAAANPTVRFSRQTTGSLATERHYSANLGGEFLKKCRATFDIPGLRLFLEE